LPEQLQNKDGNAKDYLCPNSTYL